MDKLAGFEAQRTRLRAVAYRLLGSAAEADDAVQETWLRLHRTDGIDNLAAWLTTVVSRVCLDMLRARREDPVAELPDRPWDGAEPAEEAELADDVGRAMLVVLDRLAPAERVAFVLHDLFALPFDRIAPILDRTTVASKKLASRARHRVHAAPDATATDVTAHRAVVEAFLSAARGGDLAALLAVLAPDVVRHADPAVLPAGAATVSRGAATVAGETVVFGRRARFAATALIDGAVGIVVARQGHLALALTVTVHGNRISRYDVIADPARLRALQVAVLPGAGSADRVGERD